MAYHFVDNVHSKFFTPKEPSVELLDASCDRNIIVCLCSTSGKSFIASRLIQHIIHSVEVNERTVILYVADSPSVVSRQAACFQRLTNMVVGEYHSENSFKLNTRWKKPRTDNVLVMETKLAVSLFQKKMLVMSDVNLIILDGCHCVLKSGLVPMKQLMEFYNKSHIKPRILSLASSLFTSELDLNQMESSLIKMEDLLDCKIETASNVASVLRYGTLPYEVVIEYEPHQPASIDKIIEDEVLRAIDFIRDHRYDPTEIYEGFTEELQNVPDPKCEPEEVLLEFLDVLHTLGPWSADRAALVLLLQLEKMKVTTPYERHFLLLCMTSSVLVKIRAIFDDFFKDIDERDRIFNFSSPKMLRLIEILSKFQPEKTESGLDSSEDEEQTCSADNEQKKKIEENSPQDQNKNEDEDDFSKTLSDIKKSRKFFDCDCELKTKFLLNRLKYPQLKDVTYGQFIELINSNNTENERTVSLRKNNCDLSIDRTDNSLIERKIDKNDVITDRAGDQSLREVLSRGYPGRDDKKHLGKVFQKKNGYLPVCNGNILNFPHNRERKINEVKTLENYLQYHEYLLLPKFKVDRHARYSRFNASNQSKGQDDFVFRQMKTFGDADGQLCGLIFIEKKFTAKVLFHVLNDLKQADEDFSFLSVQFSIGKVIDGTKDPKGAENEHRKQELMLKRFRMRICNLLIGTSFLEEGIDLPKCNLVVRFDLPKNYGSYFNTKERARAPDSLYCHLVDPDRRQSFVTELAKYNETETMFLKMYGSLEPSEEEEKEADQYSQLVQPFCPLMKEGCRHVDLTTAIALINRYCAKLPSDTFTRLTPISSIKTVHAFGKEMFVCSIRLPINSPVKQEIEGCPMPTRALARRFAALQCCLALHSSGELDDTLQPISKESFWMREEEQLTATKEELEEMIPKDSLEPRPGTTKRRQYYYKKIADSLTNCLPVAGKPAFLYDISLALTCPLPEEQNTRGRKIHPPEDSLQGFGILTRKNIPKIGPFPIFTRSGEVQVKLQLAQSTVVLSESQINKIVTFIHYTFTSVLRLQKYLMMFDPNSSENSYFIVPTKKVLGTDGESVEVDWDFLELIYERRNQTPVFIPEEERKNFVFDPAKFEDAVVSPWYRNQDQPQYLYVAEICWNLSPKSEFPGEDYETFEEYYLKKYDIQIQNSSQALLDVDHTSARLNFLTPRYVNRKGVALPTTSEEKKKAKRENLKQKQILIPELCEIHPFPATLWRKAVCLPCILHRINALLLADQVRRMVAEEIGVGSINLDKDFHWKPLNFGWSLADVLKQTKAAQKQEAEEKKKAEMEAKKEEEMKKDEDEEEEENGEEREKSESWIEIGTWSNDMATNKFEIDELNETDSNMTFQKNLSMIEKTDSGNINGWDSFSLSDDQNSMRYCSPIKCMDDPKRDKDNFTDNSSMTSDSDYYFEEDSSSDTESNAGGLKIEFTEDNVAEAVGSNQTVSSCLNDSNEETKDEPWCYEDMEQYSKYVEDFNKNKEKRTEDIFKSGRFVEKGKPFNYTRPVRNSKLCESINEDILEDSPPFGTSYNLFPKLAEEIPEDLKNLPHTDIILKSVKETEKKTRKVLNEAEKVESSVQLQPHDFDDDITMNFSFDDQPDLEGHLGPSPSLILQALTMSNANDGINLERLETIGDSFLKYAITTYLYCIYENVHEGKLSHLRSKQVSNFNLYRLGRRKVLGESMIATKFEPHDNWLPPCYYIPKELERALIEVGVPADHWNRADIPSLKNLTEEEICQLVREKGEQLGINPDKSMPSQSIPCLNLGNIPCFIPYNLMTQHSIPDKSIADCVEALIGAYLVACGPRGALLFMSWLGIKVLPMEEKFYKTKDDSDIRKGVGCSLPVKVTTEEGEVWSQICFGELQSPKQPLLRHIPNPEGELEKLLRGFDIFEESLRYRFRDRSYLLQALTHASYSPNRLTDCYQRLEFLGDAVLDYLITRHLYEDSRHHSPGALTDLRSALVNNTIFASLAVRHNFHKYFRHLCPSLNEVIDRFVRIQEENGHSIVEECYLREEEECEEAEDVEVPKALGDVFESIAGAIFLDSGMSLDAVWKVYYRIMKNEIELFSTNVPKSPVRELFELEPETAQFGKPEKLADGKRVRVTVEVFGKGVFNGIGRNYRIAKCTAAKCALKQLKRKGLLERRK